jgi:deoxyribonuclease-4
MGAEVVQLFAQSSRQWRLPGRADEVYAAYRAAVTKSPVVTATVCHAPYLINVISPDRLTEVRSRESLAANLRAATALGAFALVLHPGSHRGTAERTAVGRIARRVLDALEGTGGTCDVLLENTAGGGGTVGRTFGELAAIIDAAGRDPRVGVCIDTQHLWASGVSYATLAEADEVVGRLEAEIGLDRVRCLHLNDSKVPLGANSDRHENLGRGAIGAAPLRALLGHPGLQHAPAVLEVPGIEGHGPGRADLAVARRLHAAGLRARRERAH